MTDTLRDKALEFFYEECMDALQKAKQANISVEKLTEGRWVLLSTEDNRHLVEYLIEQKLVYIPNSEIEPQGTNLDGMFGCELSELGWDYMKLLKL